ncbi:MAG: WYL domain-containing protein [Marinobacter sp.]|uniref:WYL domain-containing protein n=1 Tax=Marinobacter sp. TaxID=50741 RepID=UPI003F9B4887
MKGTTLKTPLQKREKAVTLSSPTRGEWFQAQRLRFIETRLFWSGSLTSKDLTETFNIHRSVASRDFGAYQELAPRNMLYNRSARCFVAGRYFLPIFGSPTLDKLSAHSVLEDQFPGEESIFQWLPQIHRHVDPAIARNVAECIRSESDLLIVYRSMKEPEGLERWISPKALVSDGRRWHVRAYCHTRNGYRDFVIGRIATADRTRQHDSELPVDDDWETVVPIHIIPHPSLSEAQKSLVRMDYNMDETGFEMKCRKALLLYALVGMGLDNDECPPKQVLALADPSIRSLL